MITEDEAKQLIDKISPNINKIMSEAWRKIHSANLRFKSRGRANIMWDELSELAKTEFVDNDEIKIIEKNQSIQYWMREDVVFRFKKGDSKGYTRNYPTQTALDFHNPQSTIFPDVSKLEIAYVLDKAEIEICDIIVVHRNHNKVNFMFSILNRDNVVKLPRKEKESVAAEQIRSSKITLKNKNLDKENSGENE